MNRVQEILKRNRETAANAAAPSAEQLKTARKNYMELRSAASTAKNRASTAIAPDARPLGQGRSRKTALESQAYLGLEKQKQYTKEARQHGQNAAMLTLRGRHDEALAEKEAAEQKRSMASDSYSSANNARIALNKIPAKSQTVQYTDEEIRQMPVRKAQIMRDLEAMEENLGFLAYQEAISQGKTSGLTELKEKYRKKNPDFEVQWAKAEKLWNEREQLTAFAKNYLLKRQAADAVEFYEGVYAQDEYAPRIAQEGEILYNSYLNATVRNPDAIVHGGAPAIDDYEARNEAERAQAQQDWWREHYGSLPNLGLWQNTFLTEKEKNIFFYLLKEKGANHAMEYFRNVQAELPQRQGEHEAEEILAEDKALLRGLKGMGYAAKTGVNSTLNSYWKNLTGDDSATAGELGLAHLRGNSSSFAAHVYGAANTVGRMAPGLLAATATGDPDVAGDVFRVFLAAGASGDGYAYAKKRGHGEFQSRLYSAAAAALAVTADKFISGTGKMTGLTEELLLSRVTKLDNALFRAVGSATVRAGTEIAEEELELFLEPVLKKLLLDEEYDVPTWEAVADTAIETAISTLFLEGGSVARDTFTKPTKDTGKVAPLVRAVTGEAPHSSALQTPSPQGEGFGVIEGSALQSAGTAANEGVAAAQMSPVQTAETQKTADSDVETTANGANEPVTESDLPEYLAVGAREHVRNQKIDQLQGNGSPLLTSVKAIRSFIKNSFGGKNKDTIKCYGKVGTKMSTDILQKSNGAVNTDGYYLELDANRLEHLTDHIDDDVDPRNIPLTEEQALNLTAYIDEYDDVLDVIARKDGSVRILLGKKINGHAVIVELVSKGRKSVQPVTAWQNTTEHYLKKYKKTAGTATTSYPQSTDGTRGYTTIPASEVSAASQMGLTAETSINTSITDSAENSNGDFGERETGGRNYEQEQNYPAEGGRQQDPSRSGGTDLSDGDQGRSSDIRAGEQTGRLSQDTGRGRKALDRQRAAEFRRAYAREHGISRSPWELGVRQGVEESALLEIPRSAYMDNPTEAMAELKKVDEEVFAMTGIHPTFVTGEIRVRGADGKLRPVLGVYTGERIVLQADHHKYDVSVLGRHEVFHYLCKTNPTLRKRIWEQLLEMEKNKQLLLTARDRCADRLAGVYESKEAESNAIEELLANVYAGINVFGEQTEGMAAIVRAEADAAGGLNQTAAVTARTTGPPTGDSYFIVALEDGRVYVQAERKVITGTTRAEIRRNITNFFNRLLEKNGKLDIPTLDGDVLTITKEETADKAKDAQKPGLDKQLMSDDEFALKGRIEAHIDELAEVSKQRQARRKPDKKNHPFARDGFTYRTAYFRDFDGQYYEVTLSVGHNGSAATVYNVDKKESVSPTAKIIAVMGSKARSETLFDTSIPNAAEKSNRKVSTNSDKAHFAADGKFVLPKVEGDGENSHQDLYFVRPEFKQEFETWYETTDASDRMTDGGWFNVGTTSEALRSFGVKDGPIYWRKSKVGYIMEEHPEMTPDVVAQVPEIIERPILVLKSLTQEDSIVVFAELTSEGKPILAVLNLTPIPTGGMEAEFTLIASAYGRGKNSTANLIKRSDVMYLDPDKKRTDTWLMSLGLQLPSGQPVYGPIGSISYTGKNVNIEGVPFSSLLNPGTAETNSDKAHFAADGKFVLPKVKEDGENSHQDLYFIDPELDSTLDAVLQGTFDSARNEVYIGETSNFLVEELGADSLPVQMPARKAYAAMVSEERARAENRYDPSLNYHDLGKEKYLRILEKSETPVAAFADTPNADGNERLDRIVLVTDETVGGEPAVVIVAMNVKGRQNGRIIEANKDITVYPRDTIGRDIAKAAKEGRLLFLDRKRSRNLPAVGLGANSPAVATDIDFNSNIRNFWGKIKWENAAKDGNLSTKRDTAPEPAPWQKKLLEAGSRFPKEATNSDKAHFAADGKFVLPKVEEDSYFYDGEEDDGRIVLPKAEQDGEAGLDGTASERYNNNTETLTAERRWENEFDAAGNPVYATTREEANITPVDYDLLRETRSKSDEMFGISKEETLDLRNYIRVSFGIINRKLRGNTVDPVKDRPGIERLMTALKKFPAYSGRTYRNLQFFNERDFKAFLKEYALGETVSDKGFSSSSKRPNGYPKFGEYVVHLVIDGESGADIADTYGYQRQQEVVYLPDTPMTVTKIATANDGHPLIYMQEVLDYDKGRNFENGRSPRSAEGNDEDQKYQPERTNRTDREVRGNAWGVRGRDGALSQRGESDHAGISVGTGRTEQPARFTADGKLILPKVEEDSYFYDGEEGGTAAMAPETEEAALERELRRLQDVEYQKGLLEDGGMDALKKNEKRIESLKRRLEKLQGKETEKKPREKKTAAKGKPKPAEAIRTLRKEMLSLFQIPEGKRGELGKLIDACAGEILRRGALTEDARKALFTKLYENGTMTMETDAFYARGREALYNSRIYVDESLRAELGEEWKKLHRRAFDAGLFLTSDPSAPTVDTAAAQMASDMPYLFDEREFDRRTMLERMVQVAVEGQAENKSLAEYAATFEDEPDFMEEENRLTKLEREVETALRSFAKNAELEVKLRERSEREISNERRKNQEARKRRQAEKQLSLMQQQTMKELQWLKKNWRKVKPEDLEAGKVPPELKRTWENILSDVDLYAVKTAEDMRWSKAYRFTWRDIGKFGKQNEDGETFFMTEDLKRIVSRVNNEKIAEMDPDALGDLLLAAIAVRKACQDRYRILDETERQNALELFEDTRKTMKNLPAETIKGMGKAVQWYNNKQLHYMNKLLRMCGGDTNSGFYAMAKQLEKGQTDTERYQAEAERILAEFLEKNKKWLRTADGQGKHGQWYKVEIPECLAMEFGKTPEFGRSFAIWMTPLQKVQLYLESKGQDNLRHMLGGRTFPNKTRYQKGEGLNAFGQDSEGAAGTSNENRPITIRMAPSTVRAITADLTETELELAELLEKYYNKFAKDEINRVSNALYGYDKAMGSYYAPVYCNDNFTQSKAGIYDATAEGVGRLKERTRGSKTPSLNLSAAEAFSKHVAQTSKFVGMAVPARNWKTFLNVTTFDDHGYPESTKSVIERQWGKEGVEFIEDTVLTELQDSRKTKKSGFGKAADKVYREGVKAIFALNPSAAFKQPGSVFLAAGILDGKLAPSLKQIFRKNRKLIDKYTYILDWRERGKTSVEIKALSDDEEDWTQKGKVTKFIFGGAMAKADTFTAKLLWPWAENQVRQDYPELEMGTDDEIAAGESPFYKKVAEVFEEAVNMSQSVSDVMHTSELRKAEDPLSRMVTLFKPDSAQTYNLLARNIMIAKHLKRSGAAESEIRRANIRIGRTVLGSLLSGVYSAAVAFVISLWKYKDDKYKDEEGGMTAESILKGMGKDILTGFVSTLAGGEEIAEVIGNAVSGEKWYGVDTPGMSQLEDFISGFYGNGKKVIAFFREASDAVENGGDLQEFYRRKGKSLVGALSKMTEVAAKYLGGIPVDNIKGYIGGPLKRFLPGMSAEMEDWFQVPEKSDLNGLKGKALKRRVANIFQNRAGGDGVSDAAVEAAARLYAAGYKQAVPSDTPESVTVDKKKIELNEAQKQILDRVWQETVPDLLEDLVESAEFRSASEEDQAKAIEKIYDYALELGKEKALPNYDAGELELETEKDPSMWLVGKAIVGRDGAEGYLKIAELPLQDSMKMDMLEKSMGESDYKGLLLAREEGLTVYQYCYFLYLVKEAKAKKQEEVWEVIDGMDITRKQKDALHYAKNYSEETLWDAPWR